MHMCRNGWAGPIYLQLHTVDVQIMQIFIDENIQIYMNTYMYVFKYMCMYIYTYIYTYIYLFIYIELYDLPIHRHQVFVPRSKSSKEESALVGKIKKIRRHRVPSGLRLKR